MSARDTMLLALTRYYRTNTDPRGTAVQLLDGYDAARRAELLEMRADVRDRMRRDAHASGRAEALAADGQAYDGELTMLRHLVRTLRVVVREDGSAEKQRAEVRRLLHHHAADEAAAYDEAREKSSPTGADATPGPTGRVAQLLDAIRTARGRWTTVTAFRFYRDHIRALDHISNTQLRAVARGDLRDLAAWGHLVRHEEPGRQYYTLKTRKDGGS